MGDTISAPTTKIVTPPTMLRMLSGSSILLAKRGKRDSRDVIEAYGHAARSQVQPAFHEAGEKIASHGKRRDQSANIPSKTH